ncbi:MAG TPA: hypothetical protein VM912_16790 [Terriglobales bacterium]|nr:hypothetical protein [Terriglobales bacterium]
MRAIDVSSAVLKSNLNNSENAFELLFDSFVEPAKTRARTSVTSARQLLFRIGPVFVDLQVGRESSSDRASLIGQMLDSSNPGHPPVGIPVILLDGGRSVARTCSNDNGEFQLEFVMKKNLQLSVAVNRDNPVSLPITSAPGKTIECGDRPKATAVVDTRSMTHQ